jgi:hypothetical protein
LRPRRRSPIFLLAVVLIGAWPTAAAGFDPAVHWAAPIPPQGPPPPGFADFEASLLPERCGACHPDQFDDWRTARHAVAMGPGVTGQLNPPWLSNRAAEGCRNCHAPLAEQRRWKIDGPDATIPNDLYDAELAAVGVSCAGCHVRRHVRYGPTPRQPSSDADLPHGGFVAVADFGSADFCKPCHQFPPDGRRIAGKLLEATYDQWKASRFADDNIACAGCHMPDRRHLWRGIHDREMTRRGVAITPRLADGLLTVIVANDATGHHFPTYVTPQVAVRAYAGKRSLGEKWIGWKVPLDLRGEEYDTRIPAGDATTFFFPAPGVMTARVVVTVYPDEFYHRFFAALAANPPVGVDRGAMEAARDETGASAYVLWEKEVVRVRR